MSTLAWLGVECLQIIANLALLIAAVEMAIGMGGGRKR